MNCGDSRASFYTAELMSSKALDQFDRDSTGLPTKDNERSELKTQLYLKFLQSVTVEDPSFQKDVLLDITLGTLINEHSSDKWMATLNDNRSQENSRGELFQPMDLYAYGTPVRRRLSHITRKRLLLAIQKTLCSMTQFFHGVIDNEVTPLPEAIQICKINIASMEEAIRTISSRLTELMMEIQKKCDHLKQEMELAKSMIFPLYDSARTASIDILAATIEASLVKLSLTKARSERALYNYGSKQNVGQTVAQAIGAAYGTLKNEEQDMKMERRKLDQQLQEYETLLQIVDDNNGGYQQIINDWTKVKRETDECLKDLRRLGWSRD